MNYGLYMAASGLLVNQHRQDVLANNMANVNTTGFKPNFAFVKQRDPERIEDALPLENPNRLLEGLGGGVLANPTNTKFVNGSLSRTGEPLDVAIEGEGFLTLTTGKGDSEQRFRFTRDGRMTIDKAGYLVHAGSGMKILDENERTIILDRALGVEIQPNGDVLQNGQRAANLRLVTVPDVQSFKKAGMNTFILDSAASESRQPATGEMVQGWIEDSAVDPLMTLMAINQASSAVSANAGMIHYYDELMNSAINRLGRVT